MALGAGVKAFRVKADRRMNDMTEQTVVAVGDAAIKASPRDTGLFQSNWFMGVDAPQLLTVDQVTAPELKGDEFPAQAAGHRYFISQSLPYAARLEFGFVGPDALGRIYNQAGLGFAAAVGMQMKGIAEGIARKVAST